MIIDCISDLHGHFPELEGGDLLIVAGDLTRRGEDDEFAYFAASLSMQDYAKKIVIAGNHDNIFVPGPKLGCAPLGFQYTMKHADPRIEYLCDSGTEFQGLKIWGSPWTETFQGMNPHCKAFTTNSDDHLHAIWIETIPDDVDILITHAAPFGILDSIQNYNSGKIKYCGSDALLNIVKKLKPKLHIFGHIHEGYGNYINSSTLFINASIVNENYQPVNKPIRVIL